MNFMRRRKSFILGGHIFKSVSNFDPINSIKLIWSCISCFFFLFIRDFFIYFLFFVFSLNTWLSHIFFVFCFVFQFCLDFPSRRWQFTGTQERGVTIFILSFQFHSFLNVETFICIYVIWDCYLVFLIAVHAITRSSR